MIKMIRVTVTIIMITKVIISVVIIMTTKAYMFVYEKSVNMHTLIFFLSLSD